MFPPPKDQIDITAPEFETTPLVKPTGFREYDARWLFPQEINLMGIQALGFGLGNVLQELLDTGKTPAIVVGHDYRSYSQSIKLALINGLISAGVEVHDIGLALSPTGSPFHAITGLPQAPPGPPPASRTPSASRRRS